MSVLSPIVFTPPNHLGLYMHWVPLIWLTHCPLDFSAADMRGMGVLRPVKQGWGASDKLAGLGR
jgi:hypothetical protein